MPYNVEKRGNEYCLIREDGSTKQCHDTKEKAEKGRRAIMMVEHGGKLTEQK